MQRVEEMAIEKTFFLFSLVCHIAILGAEQSLGFLCHAILRSDEKGSMSLTNERDFSFLILIF